MLQVNKLNKIYENGTHALKDVSFEVKEGEFLVVIGLSGSGKSTLLRCLNRLVNPSSGEILFDDKNIIELEGGGLRNIRRQIGMIFQHFNLIPRRTVETNVLLGGAAKTGTLKSILGMYSEKEKQEAKEYIDIVGLTGKEKQRADQLSGGQQQRVSIARSLMQKPKLLLADEPVASLDPATSHSVMDYLKKVNEEYGVTVICNLHFLSLVREYATRVIALKDGELVFNGRPDEIDEQWFKEIYGDEAKEVRIQ
jgi:phosphonate transport system ATP-binding protein